METEHSAKSPPLPAKLRWRPYANGNTFKAKKPRKDPGLDTPTTTDPKAVAHKIRAVNKSPSHAGPGSSTLGSKVHSPPPLCGIMLQWEEAETTESMSHGGLVHHSPNAARSPSSPHPAHQYSRDSSPVAISPTVSSPASDTSDTLDASVDGTSDSNSANGKSGFGRVSDAIWRAVSSLPSPPPSNPSSLKVDMVGAGEVDLQLFKATLAGLTPSGTNIDLLLQHHLRQQQQQQQQQPPGIENGSPTILDFSLASIASNTAYQMALNALFASTPMAQATATKNATLFSQDTATSPTSSTTPTPTMDASSMAIQVEGPLSAAASSLLGTCTFQDTFLSDPNRMLTPDELLGVATIDELLASCRFATAAATAVAAQASSKSPAVTNNSNGINSTLLQQAAFALASPTSSIASISSTSSPMGSLLGLASVSPTSAGANSNKNGNEYFARTTSPASNSFSPMAVSHTALETLLAQPIISWKNQQSPQSPQQQSVHMTSPTLPDSLGSRSSVGSIDAFSGLVQDLGSPFALLTPPNSQGDVLMANVTALSSASPGTTTTTTTTGMLWPSLFPAAEDFAMMEPHQTSLVSNITAAAEPLAPQRVEMSTQTDLPYDEPMSGPLSPISAHIGSPPHMAPSSDTSTPLHSQQNSPQSQLGLFEDELDPDWLSFLDEAQTMIRQDEQDAMQLPSPPLSQDSDGDVSMREKEKSAAGLSSASSSGKEP
ncbi:hypothetical protein BGW38_005692, partial [Lunasporangiospora selenospora]